MSLEPARQQNPSALGKLLSFHVTHDFFEPETVARLLDHARAIEPKLRPTKVNAGVDLGIWNSRTTNDLGALAKPLTAKMRDCAPALIAALKMSKFEIARIELELIAYNDGAFSKTHVDLVARDDPGSRTYRAISAAYYFHRQPKGFSGGALRFHPLATSAAAPAFADVEPVHNSLVAFPAFAPHEVLPVRCPSKAFMDSRFAIYYGIHRARA